MARLSKALKTEESELACVESVVESKVEASETNDSNADIHDDASNDSTDIDFANIVVIDEYDSTKNDSKNDSSSKRVRIVFDNPKKTLPYSIDLIYFFRVHLANRMNVNVNIVGLKSGIACRKTRKFFAIQLSTVRWISSPVK